MAFYLEKAIFINRAPFEHLELDFKKKGITVLTAVNGKGKTTILSHIVDAFYELARTHYSNEFEGKEKKYYRISSSIFNLNTDKPSFVYFRFVNDDKKVDYIDIRNKCTQLEYDNSINIVEKIPFAKFSDSFENQSNVKYWHLGSEQEHFVRSVFENNILTYFPSYRYETPSYLNDSYSIKMNYKIEGRFSGYLINPIEVVSGIRQIANWIMDVVLDWETYKQTQQVQFPDGVTRTVDNSPELNIWNNLNEVLRNALLSKNIEGKIRMGIGKRNSAGVRLSVVTDQNGSISTISPNLFCLSAGESALLCCFGEILRQADEIHPNALLNTIQGIVLIDEVDKHLHIKLQKEVLPKLFKLFPNIQFIVSSHSPFLNMGLADEAIGRTQIIDLDNNGIVCEPTNNDLYKEVYEMMINENQRFADRYKNLLDQIKMNAKPIIITEGKTDYRHIKKAMSVLERNDIDVDFYQVPDNWGSSELKGMLEYLSRIKQQRIVIGIFDRDEPNDLSYLDVENQQYKSYGDSNVYSFAIPLVNEDIYGNSISIEHYYNRNNLLKEDPVNHRRLFLGSEFHPSGNSKDGNYQTKISNIKHKVEVNGVIDDKVFASTDLEQLHSIALTKDAYTTLVETDDDFIKDFDFSNFNLIIDVISDISNRPLYN